jgi:primosomal replication protein N
MFTSLKVFNTCLLFTQIHTGLMVVLNCVPDVASNVESVKKTYKNCFLTTYIYQNGMHKLKKIPSNEAEVQCMVWCARFMPIATNEHNFQHMYGIVLPNAILTCQGFIQLIETRNKLKQEPAGRQQTSEDDNEWVRVSCLWCPHYSQLQLTIPHTMIQNVFHQ